MPFRIKVSLVILVALGLALTVGPLVYPIAPLDTVPVEGLFDPDSRLATVQGVRLHYKTAGETTPDGPAFVLLHGFGASVYSWHELMAPLGEIGFAVAFDRPAFGLSERPTAWRGVNPYGPEAQVDLTIGLMDTLGLDRAVLIGNSSGGAVAAQVALEHPERVAGLVLIGAAVYRSGGAPAWTRPLLYTPQLDRLGPVFMRGLAGEPGENFLASAWSDPSRLDQATRDAYREPLRVDGWDRALWELSRASREPGLEGKLTSIAVPGLVVTGADDRIVPPELSERLATDLPDAELVVLPGCGHVPQEECPDALQEVLRRWLTERGLAPEVAPAAAP